MIQSNDEILRVFDEWGRNFAPSNFVQNEKNAKLLFDHVVKMHGVVSISGLNEAVNALAGQLDLTPLQKKTREQILAEHQADERARHAREVEESKKQQARSRREYQESLKHQTVKGVQEINAESAAAAKNAADAKELQTIKSKIAREISDYLAGHPSGRTNYSLTEHGRNKLNKEAGNYQAVTVVAEANRVLENVRAAKSRLP
jgi:hypothetical protein